MNASFKQFFSTCQPEFKSLHGVSWEEKPELYYQYLQTRYLAQIAESLGAGQQGVGASASVKNNLTGFAAQAEEEEYQTRQKQQKEHIET